MSTAISPVVGVLPRIDWSNPITRGLVALCVPLPGSNTYIELVTGVIGTPTAMLAPKPFPRNGGKSTVPWVYAPQNDGTATSRVVWPASATVRGGNLTSRFSIVALAGIGAGNGTLGVIGGNGDTVSTGNGIGVAIDNGYIAGYGGIRGVVSAVDSTPIGSANAVLGNPTSDRVHCFGLASDGATVTWLHAGTSSQSTYAYNEASSANRRLAVCGPATGNGSNNKVFVGWFALWDRPISVAEYASLYADSWQLIDDDGSTFGVDEWIPVSAGGGSSAALEAASAIALTASGSLTTAIELAASATGAGQAAGDLATSIPLAGVSVSATLAAGELTTQIRLAGDALAAVSAGGDLTTAIRLSADSVVAALATGALTAGSSGLAGDATAGVAAAGDLTTSIPLAGGATVSVIAAGELATTISLAGAAVGVVSATGDLVVALQLSADAVAAALAGATLTTSIAMSGAAVAAAVAAGSLTAPSTLQQIGNRGIGAETPLIPGVRLGDTHADFSAPRLGGASPGISGRRIGVTAPRPFRRI